MATHSSILALEIPWAEEPGRLQSMGSQKVVTTERLKKKKKSIEITQTEIDEEERMNKT